MNSVSLFHLFTQTLMVPADEWQMLKIAMLYLVKGLDANLTLVNWLCTVYMLQVMWPVSLLTILLRTGYLYQLAALALLLIHR